MSDKQYRVTIQIACDATVIDKTARANMGTVDDILEKLLDDWTGSAVTITVTEAANIATVREKSDKPRAKRGAAVADELAALKARVEAMSLGGVVEAHGDRLAPQLSDEQRTGPESSSGEDGEIFAQFDVPVSGKTKRGVAA